MASFVQDALNQCSFGNNAAQYAAFGYHQGWQARVRAASQDLAQCGGLIAAKGHPALAEVAHLCTQDFVKRFDLRLLAADGDRAKVVVPINAENHVGMAALSEIANA